MDMDAFMAFVGKFAGDLGAVVAAGNVVVGDRLGLYRALADSGPATAAELAARTGTDERYVAEWLAGQAAGGYVEFGGGRFSMTAEQAFALADPSGPVDVAGAFQLALGAVAAVPAIAEAFRTGAGVGWHEQSADVFSGCERFFRAGYAAHLVQDWLPALPGIVSRLAAGGSVADVGCGLGASSVLLASAFPAARVERFRLPRRVHHARGQAGGRRRGRGPGDVRDRVRDDILRHRVRPGDDVRLPARHGRPGGGRAAHPLRARRRRVMADRGADGRGHRGGEPQPGGTGVLQLLHAALPAERAVAGRV